MRILLAQAKILYVIIMGKMVWNASAVKLTIVLVVCILFFRITSLQDVHRAHQREYEKYMEDIESSKMTVQELEKSSDAALNYKFYRAMKTYVENLINCLNEKVCIFSPSFFSFRW